MTNQDIAATFETIAQLLAIQNANRFRVLAYERAAEVIASLPFSLRDRYDAAGRDGLEEIQGIGRDLALKIEELLTRGRLRYLAELQREIPKGLLDVLAIEGMGPVKTRFVWQAFGVRNLRDLKRLLASGALLAAPGWGSQSVDNIRRAIEMHEGFRGRMPIGHAQPIVDTILAALRASSFVSRAEIAGSYRRRRDTVGDLDFLVTSKQPKRTMEVFCALPEVRRVIARGPTKANVLLRAGIEADLRVLDPQVFGAALHYFTGSKAHNVHARTIAKARGLTISEYGVFRGTRDRKGKRVACRTEEDVFRSIQLPYIPPELREDTGEIEAAAAGKLPNLIEARHLTGDLHAHSTFSDGSASMEEMIAAAKRAGFQYLALTDHASVHGMVAGVKEHNIGAYVRRVRAAARKVRGIRVLVGAEVDILDDGTLYLSDAALRQLDWVVASVHQQFRQSSAQATMRFIRAMEHSLVRVIGHPSTRIIGRRDGMTLDWEVIMDTAKRTGTFLEVSAAWKRLDLSDVHCRMAHDRGVRVCISSDAHGVESFDPQFGVATARRGWIEKGDVVNAVPWSTFEKRFLKRKTP